MIVKTNAVEIKVPKGKRPLGCMRGNRTYGVEVKKAWLVLTIELQKGGAIYAHGQLNPDT